MMWKIAAQLCITCKQNEERRWIHHRFGAARVVWDSDVFLGMWVGWGGVMRIRLNTN